LWIVAVRELLDPFVRGQFPGGRFAQFQRYAAEQSLMIGDHSHDVLGAKANGIDAIGVTYGYGSHEELIAAGAQHLCASPRAILEVILGAPANAASAVNPS